MDAPAVRVVVPALNAAQTIGPVLDALAAQTLPAERFEVVVVDDGSTDSTAQLARDSGLASVVSAGHRQGLAAARNLGAEGASAQAIAFLDADCVPAPTWAENGVAALTVSGADVVGGRIDVGLGRRPTAASLLSLAYDFDQERYVAEGFSAGGNLWVTRALFEAVGGFDGRLSSGSEDNDFGQRVTAAGARLAYAPDVVVVHPSRSTRDLLRRSYRDGIGAAQTGRSHVRARRESGPYVTPERMRMRLEAHGQRPGPAMRLMIQVVRNFCVRLPLLAGNVVGSYRARRG